MNALTRRVIGWLAQALDSDERAAVLGDHQELGVSNLRAARDVLDLILRRQLEAFRDWRAWLILLGIVLPFGLFLTAQSLSLGLDLTPREGWIHSLPSDSSGQALWNVVVYPLFVATFALPVAILAWSSGYLIGFFSGRARITNTTFLLLIWAGVLFVELRWPDPRHVNDAGRLSARAVLFAAALHLLAFVLPVWAGLRRGFGRKAIPLYLALIIAVSPTLPLVAIGVDVALASSDPDFSWGPFAGLILAIAWPGALLVLSRRLTANDRPPA